MFRVNRILQRLGNLDTQFIEPILKLPPIYAIEPFEEDDTGRVFKSYPGHMELFNRAGLSLLHALIY